MPAPAKRPPTDDELSKLTPAQRSDEIAKALTSAEAFALPDEAWNERYRRFLRGPFGFEFRQRRAMALAESTLVPKSYQKNVPNCMVADEIAERSDMPVSMVMQNLDVINGMPAWRAQYIIACINTCGKFKGTIRYVMKGEGMGRSCRVVMTDKYTGEAVEGTEVSMAMAKAKGWLDRTGSPWKEMPELMLRYRAGSFFGKQYVPEKLMGMPDVYEAREIIDVTPDKITERPAASGIAGAKELLGSSDSR
jgi:hypothetical protein